MRGSVSLAAALAIPMTVAGGDAFPDRNVIVVLTFSVIAVTLLGQGMTLPSIAARIRPAPDRSDDEDEVRAVSAMREAGLRHLTALERDGKIVGEMAEYLRRWYSERRRRVRDDASNVNQECERARIEVVRELVAVERSTLIDARERGEIDNRAFRRVEALLDIDELGLDRHIPAPEG
jgi:CPA1 family monovalent cation:H+ antiporter